MDRAGENCSVLGEDVELGMEEFNPFFKEVFNEVESQAGEVP